jgi:peptide-methionine (S)-S-oxide reductase
MWLLKKKSADLPTADQALPGRAARAYAVPARHAVLGHELEPPYPAGIEVAHFGMGCFWGAERRFWQQEGVWTTAAGYAAGTTPNPTYEEVCSGLTGHNEVVLVAWDPAVISFEALLKVFFESHDPTQGMRQGNDVGTQYRSGIYTTTEVQLAAAKATATAYGRKLAAAGMGRVTTEIAPAGEFWFAEGYHQQYLAKNPMGYCGLRGTGVACAIDTAETMTPA